MEFFIVFFVSLLVLICVALSLLLGKAPTYRPERESVHKLLLAVVSKHAVNDEWELFLSLPISHDPELESVRQRCLTLTYGDYDIPPAGEGLNGAIFDKRGMLRLKEIIAAFEKVLAEQPNYRIF